MFAREIRRADRHAANLSCLFIDLDRFKLLNDRHGHLDGSRALANVGLTLRESVRAGDSIGRYGGDEFVAVLPETGEQDALQLAERIRTRIADATRESPFGTIDVSIGVAQRRPESSLEEILFAADVALRIAKEAGGAKVIGASALGAVSD